jgi:hypothetical protein
LKLGCFRAAILQRPSLLSQQLFRGLSQLPALRVSNISSFLAGFPGMLYEICQLHEFAGRHPLNSTNCCLHLYLAFSETTFLIRHSAHTFNLTICSQPETGTSPAFGLIQPFYPILSHKLHKGVIHQSNVVIDRVQCLFGFPILKWQPTLGVIAHHLFL